MFSSNIFLMENHNEALGFWRKRNLKDKTLVHIDSHFDFAWIADKDPAEILSLDSLDGFKKNIGKNHLWNLSGRPNEELVHIGNYIEPAIKEGIINEFYWVVPDYFCSGKMQLGRLKKEIRNTLIKSLKDTIEIKIENNSLLGRIGDIALIVCPLAGLPRLEEDILLDIDVDYFIRGNTLWLSPDKFVEIVKPKLRSCVITIAYSVEGGFTPIEYKFIGDYLACLLDDAKAKNNQGFKEAMESLLKAIDAQRKELPKDAESFLMQALTICPDYAAIHYHLSMLYSSLGLKDSSRNYYWQAISRDASYQTPYNNRGPVLESNSKLTQATQEYERMLELDPENFNYYLRLGNIFSQKKHWDQALQNYLRALEINPQCPEAYSGLGYVLLKKKRPNDALESLHQSLALKPHNPFANYWAGVIYMKKKKYNQAMRFIRHALNNGLFTLPQARWRMVLIYGKNKVYNRMFDEFKNACIASYYDIIKRIKCLPG